MNERHHLVLVAAPAQAVGQDDITLDRPARTHSLETTLRTRGPGRVRDTEAQHPPKARIPFAIHMTADQILEVAADAEFRAEILHDFANAHVEGRARQATGRILTGTRGRRAGDLLHVAADLRRIAADLVDDGGGR